MNDNLHETEVKVVGLSFRHIKNKLEVGDKVKLVPEPTNKYDPNALSIQTLSGELVGYVGKSDRLRSKILKRASSEEVTLPILVANYYKDGEDKLWESVEEGDLVQLWLRAYSLAPIEDSFTEIESFTGEKVRWSEYLHICTDLKGNELIGGSTYASKFEKGFDSERIAKAYAKKNGLDEIELKEYWKSLGDTANNYGTSIHKALEHYNKFNKPFGAEALPRVPHLREVVKQFLAVSNFNNCVAEPLITDTEKGMSGWVDNLRFLDKKNVVVEDYKTNTFKDDAAYYSKWASKLDYYKKQLDYYGTILENHGYTVASLVIWHWHKGKWDKHELKFDKIKEYSR
jgi:hypothetical protein